MNNHPGYFIDTHSGQPWYRCLRCQYDTFSHENAQYHGRLAHDPIAIPADLPNRLIGKTIGISLLTWNTVNASLHAIAAIARERRLLAGLGIRTRVFWADNGSTDGTYQAVHDLAQSEAPDTLFFDKIIPNTTNVGQSAARNGLIDAALAAGVDYLLMVDGDIEIVPFSAYALANHLDALPENVGCVGVYCRNCTDNAKDPDLTTEFRVLTAEMTSVDPAIAWTNYGVFRREVLEKCQFDADGPFGGPGWGFEDDDYYLQMLTEGYYSLNTKWVRHLHRKRHSSLRLLDRTLAAKVFADRQMYLVTKWSESRHPEIRKIVAQIANQTMPVV